MKRAILFLEPKGTVLEVVRAAKKRGLCVVAMVSDQGLLDSAPEPYRTAVSLIDEIREGLECARGLAALLGVTIECLVDGDHERRERHDRPRLDECERRERDAEAGLGRG